MSHQLVPGIRPFGARAALVSIATLVLLMLSPGSAEAATGTVQIIQGGTGQGTITSTPAGINCTIGRTGPTGTCLATFEEGTRVKLKAVAADNSKFLGWAPVRTCPKPNLTVQPGETIECQPVFELIDSDVLLQAVPEGSGTVTQSVDGTTTASCTSDVDAGTVTGVCAAVYANGTVVSLTATPAVGWEFVAWRTETTKDKDDDCADAVVTMDKPERCVAVFLRL